LKNIEQAMKIKFGKRELEFPSPEIKELRSSNDAKEDFSELKRRLSEDGYLLLRGFIEPEKVAAAREKVLTYIAKHNAIQPNTPLLEGCMRAGAKRVNMEGFMGITSDPAVQEVLENPGIFQLFDSLFGKKSDTFSYKWLRAVGNEEYTGAHCDTVYMGRGSKNLHTVWVPLGEISPQLGSLAMCEGSNHLPEFDKLKNTYGKMDVDKDLVEGWFSREPLEIVQRFGGQWRTTTYYPGDLIIFGMFTMHASTTNLTNRYRLSCDIRYQPQNEAFDDRWAGKNPKGHGDSISKPLKSMEEARAGWGL